MILEECKNTAKEKTITRYINNESENCSDDSDEEICDKEYIDYDLGCVIITRFFSVNHPKKLLDFFKYFFSHLKWLPPCRLDIIKKTKKGYKKRPCRVS